MSLKSLLAWCLLMPAVCAAGDRVSVSGGVLEGTTSADSSIRIFKGVPFAAPPVGDLRWRAPQPVPEWEGARRADYWGTRCMQGDMFGGPLITRDTTMGEDCLYLNVWTPAESADENHPVLVVFHGGGFAAGSSSEPRTDGEWFARQGIVVVAVNYRLSVFGFLAHPELSAESDGRGSGNYGMLDQVAALEWVRDNVSAFGGDPDNVTINGESAGSMSVSAHMASPLSQHLFHKAIGQSGAFFASPSDSMGATSLLDRERAGVDLVVSFGADSIADLRDVSADIMLAAVMDKGGWDYPPGIDGYFMPTNVSEIYGVGEQADIPLLAGWTASELGMVIALSPEQPTAETNAAEIQTQFGPNAERIMAVYPAADNAEAAQSAADLISDLFAGFSTWKWIEVHAETSDASVYRYRFDRVRPDDPESVHGAIHADDIEYSFNTLDSKNENWHPEDYDVAMIMATAFANFVKTGDPNGGVVPDWPEFGESRQVMYFDTESGSGPEEHRDRYEVLDGLVSD